MKAVKLMAALATLTLALAPAAQAAERTELADFGAPPKGFKEGFRDMQSGMIMVELVPKGETVHNWKRLITQQSMQGYVSGVDGLRDFMTGGWLSSCPQGGDVMPVTEGEENGYPFALWQMTCPLNPQTGKPEYTWVKAVQGEEGMYVKQFAFRYAPSKDELVAATLNLKKLSVCDGSADHPCKKKKR